MNIETPFQPGDHIFAYLRDSGGDTQELSPYQQEHAMRQWCNEGGCTLSSVCVDSSGTDIL